MVKNNVQKILSIILVLALVTGCFAALPWTANAASAPVPGNPGWKTQYSKDYDSMNHPTGKLWDRGNAAGDKITSNAHSADWEGVYFYWDDKQKEDGVLLVCDWVFDLFAAPYTHAGSGITFDCNDPGFVLTAKNSNNYWGYKISRGEGDPIDIVDGVKIWAFAIPKQNQDQTIGNNGKLQTVKEDLKNINMVFIDGTYKSSWILLMKAWYNEDGKLIWKPFEVCDLNQKLSFSNGLKLGLNEDDFSEIKITDFKTAKNGKIITITETAKPAGYAFKRACVIYGNEEPTNVEGVSLKLKPGDKAAVLFENQKLKAEITVFKVWFDHNGDKICAPVNVETEFKINGEVVELKEINKVNEGQYRVEEKAIEGFELFDIEVTCNSVKVVDVNIVDLGTTINVAAGDKWTVTFINKDPITPPTGTIEILKTIEGKLIADCELPIGYDKPTVLAGVRFYLTEVIPTDGPQGFIVPVGAVSIVGNLLADGTIFFDLTGATLTRTTVEGWYKVSEEFVPGSDADKLFKVPDPLYVHYDGEHVIGKVTGFDYGALYTIVNGHSSNYIRTLGIAGLNNEGDIFYIGVTNADIDSEQYNVEYPSFCAHAGSKNFAGDNHLGCTGYLRAESLFKNEKAAYPYADFISAYNYIEDKHGSLNDNRVITQVVTWYLLGAINEDQIKGTLTFDSHPSRGLTEDEIADIIDVIENFSGYKGSGKIGDIVYMLCENEEHTYEFCQPQLVPVYGGTPVFNNKLKETFGVEFTKTKFGESFAVTTDKFGFDLFEIVDGKEEFVDTYYTNEFGKVTVDELTPGEYVFREKLSLYDIAGIAEYKLIWKAIYPKDADGLYFELKADGTVIWAGDETMADAEVDNTFWNKSVKQWVTIDQLEEFTGLGEIGEIFEDGFIFFPHGVDAGDEVIYDVDQPSCTQGGAIWFFYSKADGSKGEPLMVIYFGEPLGHGGSEEGDWYLSTVGDSLVCNRCGFQISWYDLSDDLLDLYHELGGLGGT